MTVYTSYTVPLKVHLMYYADRNYGAMHFELPKGNVTYSVDQIKDHNTITARVIVDYGADLLSKKTYEFDINSNVKASGKQVRLAWKYWNQKGEKEFKDFIVNWTREKKVLSYLLYFKAFKKGVTHASKDGLRTACGREINEEDWFGGNESVGLNFRKVECKICLKTFNL